MIRLALGTVAMLACCLAYIRAANTEFAPPLGLLAVAAAIYLVFRYDPPWGTR